MPTSRAFLCPYMSCGALLQWLASVCFKGVYFSEIKTSPNFVASLSFFGISFSLVCFGWYLILSAKYIFSLFSLITFLLLSKNLSSSVFIFYLLLSLTLSNAQLWDLSVKKSKIHPSSDPQYMMGGGISSEIVEHIDKCRLKSFIFCGNNSTTFRRNVIFYDINLLL